MEFACPLSSFFEHSAPVCNRKFLLGSSRQVQRDGRVFVKSCFESNEPTRTRGAQSRAAKQSKHGPGSHLSVHGVLSIPRTQNPHHGLIGRRFDFWVEVLIAFVLHQQARQERLTNVNNPFSALHIIATLYPPTRSQPNTSTPTRPLPPGHHPHRFDEGLDIVYRNNNPPSAVKMGESRSVSLLVLAPTPRASQTPTTADRELTRTPLADKNSCNGSTASSNSTSQRSSSAGQGESSIPRRNSSCQH